MRVVTELRGHFKDVPEIALTEDSETTVSIQKLVGGVVQDLEYTVSTVLSFRFVYTNVCFYPVSFHLQPHERWNQR
jgi:hypothetical protein